MTWLSSFSPMSVAWLYQKSALGLECTPQVSPLQHKQTKGPYRWVNIRRKKMYVNEWVAHAVHTTKMIRRPPTIHLYKTLVIPSSFQQWRWSKMYKKRIVNWMRKYVEHERRMRITLFRRLGFSLVFPSIHPPTNPLAKTLIRASQPLIIRLSSTPPPSRLNYIG